MHHTTSNPRRVIVTNLLVICGFWHCFEYPLALCCFTDFVIIIFIQRIYYVVCVLVFVYVCMYVYMYSCIVLYNINSTLCGKIKCGRMLYIIK